MSRSIVVLGSLNLDLVVDAVRIPRPGETVVGLGYWENLGGKGANQAVAAARAGASVCMLGMVGSDGYGERLRQGILDAGVEASDIRSVKGASGLALITRDPGGMNTIVIQGNANSMMDANYVGKMASKITSASLVLLQLEIPLEAVTAAARLAHEHGVPVILDPAPVCRLPQELLQCITWLTPNETEAGELLNLETAETSHKDMAQRMLQLGVRNVAMKLGAQGVFMMGKDCGPTLVPAFVTAAVDTTAAGDCFNGAFAARLALGSSPIEAARFAAAAAAICVTRHGAQISMPNLAETNEFLYANEVAQ